MALNPVKKYTVILAKFLLNLVLWERIKTVCIAIQQYMLLAFLMRLEIFEGNVKVISWEYIQYPLLPLKSHPETSLPKIAP